jgi:hypothetical protein
VLFLDDDDDDNNNNNNSLMNYMLKIFLHIPAILGVYQRVNKEDLSPLTLK